MDSLLSLAGRSILVVEEEPTIARELQRQLHRAGARVLCAGRLRDALHLAEHPAISAAVVNLKVGGDSTMAVCRRLSYLGIPFMFHTRYDVTEASQRWPGAPVLTKPTDGRVLVSRVVGLLH